jgi:2-oxoglutarate ferredoxin oxidoreductase subunit gamma
MQTEITFAGFGGQGIIKAGVIVAMAASIYCGKNAVQTQSYGPESRGGACKSDVIISDVEIDFPKVDEPDVLVVMSQQAYSEYVEKVKKGGIIILDPDLVPEEKKLEEVKVFRVPATKMAEELGMKIVGNVIMLGAFAAITKIMKKEALAKAIKANVPKGMEELNLKAFNNGYAYGLKIAKRKLG